MGQQSGVAFEQHDEVRMFIRGRNQIVETWLHDNGHRVNLGPVSSDTLSKALRGLPVLEPLPQALALMLDDMRRDPWAWCEPPERIEDVDGLRAYAGYPWWYALLKPTVPMSRFERMPKHPLPPDEAEYLQERLSDWSRRLRAVCDQHKRDHDLVEALRWDMKPEYQKWVVEDSGWREGVGTRRRIGNPGLRGRSADDVARAYALDKITLHLPMIEDARLFYKCPDVVPVHDHESEPVEPWNGQEFEGVEWDYWEDARTPGIRSEYLQVEHRVVYWWDGSRYQIEDVEKFVRVRTPLGQWRVPSLQDRDLMITGIQRKHKTVDELLARRDQEMAELSKDPEKAVVLFDAMVERLRTNQDAIDEARDVARLRAHIRQGWRRR